MKRVVANDALRSELIFLGATGIARREADCMVMLTPDNPTYWWGNTLAFDAAPANGDLARWTALFERLVRSGQPASTHTTFGWTGDERGAVEPFVAAGFDYFELVVLAADGSTAITVPHPDRSARIAVLTGDDWSKLHALLVETRDPKHSRDGFAVFAERRIAGWRALVEAGQGQWMGAWSRDHHRLLSALGVFVEREPGADGRRIGRFQHVVTDVSARRRGLAGMLVAAASRHAFERFGADTLLIIADEHDAARRVYQSVGFVTRGRQRGLERGAPPPAREKIAAFEPTASGPAPDTSS